MLSKPKLYNNKWRKARSLFLTHNPLCKMCLDQGKLRAATVVDHIEPHKQDLALFWDQSNWQALCYHHHNSTKQSQEKRGLSLIDLDGYPLDPSHHWLTNGGVS